MATPTDPETLLTRTVLADALTKAGFPITKATLATKACRGGGPPFRKFGPRPLYPWGGALEWAEGKLGPVVRSTAELDAVRQPATAASGAAPVAVETGGGAVTPTWPTRRIEF
jgi:hypothetical protein